MEEVIRVLQAQTDAAEKARQAAEEQLFVLQARVQPLEAELAAVKAVKQTELSQKATLHDLNAALAVPGVDGAGVQALGQEGHDLVKENDRLRAQVHLRADYAILLCGFDWHCLSVCEGLSSRVAHWRPFRAVCAGRSC